MSTTEVYNSQKGETLEVGQYSFHCLTQGTAGQTQIKTGAGYLGGLTINSFNTGATFSLGDGTLTSYSFIHSTMTIASGERGYDFRGERFSNGLVLNITGTLFGTVQYK